MGGYQYQSSYLDYRDVGGRLAGIGSYDLEHFQGLDAAPGSGAARRSCNEVFSAQTPHQRLSDARPRLRRQGLCRRRGHRGRGASSSPLANAGPGQAAPGRSAMPTSLPCSMRFIGFHYTDYSLAVAFPVSQGLVAGRHRALPEGQERRVQRRAHLRAVPQPTPPPRISCKSAWSGAENGFSKLNLDLGASAEFGQFFKAGLVVRNVANPVIATAVGRAAPGPAPGRRTGLPPRRPDWGSTWTSTWPSGDLYLNGQEAQPVSLGVEKGLFQNKLFLRAGFLSDLAAKYFLGPQGQHPLRAGLRLQPGKIPGRPRPGPRPAGPGEKPGDFGILHGRVKKLTIDFSFTTI